MFAVKLQEESFLDEVFFDIKLEQLELKSDGEGNKQPINSTHIKMTHCTLEHFINLPMNPKNLTKIFVKN